MQFIGNPFVFDVWNLSSMVTFIIRWTKSVSSLTVSSIGHLSNPPCVPPPPSQLGVCGVRAGRGRPPGRAERGRELRGDGAGGHPRVLCAVQPNGDLLPGLYSPRGCTYSQTMLVFAFYPYLSSSMR